MPGLNQLKREHAALSVLARQLSSMTAQEKPADSRMLYDLRMKFTSSLIRHLKTEDWLLYPRLLASADEQVVLTARAFSASMGGLAEDFRQYVERWGATAIATDWKSYQRETSQILQALETRMNRENRDLYPLLTEGSGEQGRTSAAEGVPDAGRFDLQRQDRATASSDMGARLLREYR